MSKRILAATFLALLTLRILAAAGLDLFGDEAFYWQCSRRLAWGYADHPFMTALLERLGTGLFGQSTLALRAPFLALGAATTGVLFGIGSRLVGRDDALRGTTFSLLLPALALSTFMALPDVPLLFFELAGLLAVLRAIEPETSPGQRRGWWIVAGLCAALALSTHTRGLLFPAAIGLWLVASRQGRRQLRGAAPWWGLAVAALGLVPGLIFNVEHDFAQLHYQLSERHAAGTVQPWRLLDHLGEQAAFVTPLLYLALLVVLLAALRRARRGDQGWGLLAAFSLVHLGVFFVASPFSDHAHTEVHWPLPGYVPLCLGLPELFRQVSRRGRWARGLVTAAWALPALLVLLVAVDLGTGWVGLPMVSKPFAGWSAMTARATEHLADLSRAAALPPVSPTAEPTHERGDEPANVSAAGRGLQATELASPSAPAAAELLVVGDHYYVAAQLERALPPGSKVFTLAHPRLLQHGRALQYRIWGLDEAALAEYPGRSALLVVDWSSVRHQDREAWMAHLSRRFERLNELSRLQLPGGQREFSFYSGQVRGNGG